MKKKLLIVGVALTLMAAVSAVAVLWQVGGIGQGRLERWIGGQIQAAAGLYIKPKLQFKSLDYQYPNTVVLSGVSLWADDPKYPNARVEMLAAKKVTVALEQIPQAGEPFRIDEILIEEPVLRVVTVDPNSFSPLGFSDLFIPRTDPKTVAKKSQPSPQQRDEQQKLSRVFQINSLEMTDATVVYDPRMEQAKPMSIEGIGLTLSILSSDGGWYDFSTSLDRSPLLAVALNGQFHIDDLALKIADLSLRIQLGQDNDRYLPPQLQQLRQAFALSGRLTVEGGAELTARDLTATRASATIELADAEVRVADCLLPFDLRTEAELQLADPAEDLGRVVLKKIQAEVFAGQLSGTLSAPLADPLLAQTELRLRGLRLQRAMKSGLRRLLGINGTGVLGMRLKAQMGGADWRDITASSRVRLRRGSLVVSGLRWPVSSFDAQLRLNRRKLAIKNFSAQAVSGSLRGSGWVKLTERYPALLDVSTKGLQLRELLTQVGQKKRSKYAGLISGGAHVEAPLTAWKKQTTGYGDFEVTQANLAPLPLLKAVDQVTSIGQRKKKEKEYRDWAHLVFRLEGDHARFRTFDIQTDLVVLSGQGKVYLDQQVELLFDSSPRKQSRSIYGALGKLVGKVTGGFGRYKVRGPIGDMKVRLKM